MQKIQQEGQQSNFNDRSLHDTRGQQKGDSHSERYATMKCKANAMLKGLMKAHFSKDLAHMILDRH